MTVRDLIKKLEEVEDNSIKVYNNDIIMSEYVEWEVTGYYYDENEYGEKVLKIE